MVKKQKTRVGVRKSKNNSVQKQQLFSHTPRRKYWLILGAVILSLSAGIYLSNREDLGPKLAPPPSDALYRQPNQPIDVRVIDLLSRMTLEEKIGQMALVDKNNLGKTEDISRYYLGGVLSGAGAKPEVNTAQGWRDMVDNMKEQASKSRLGIPILYGVDANHGHANVVGATVFPHAIGFGASNDSNLVKQVAAATSKELVATGINWNYSPSLDAPKDIRWGRVYESYSDSPNINSELGKAYITGTQESVDNKTYVLASAKHYLATGAMQWGQSNNENFKIDQGKTFIDETKLDSEYLPPYKSAVDAGVASIMVGLNQWGEQRIIDSKYLLTDKLKNELGFNGFVVSDWYGVYEFSGTSKYDANIKTINAGLDMAMLPYDYKIFIGDVRKAVNNGAISQERINDAVGRILRQKFKAGLFDMPTNNVGIEAVGSLEHHELARKTVASSAVLLKNNGNLLPLSKNSGRIIVAGSGADNVGRQSGAWTVEWQGVNGNWLPGGTSILQGIRQVTNGATQVDYDLNGDFDINGTKAEIGIAVVSEKPYAEGWGDNENPVIDAADQAVIEKLKESSEKVIVIILSGRPLIITDQIPNWDATIAAWLPGSEGGGIADLLFGDDSFKAKLPIVWPANMEQVPTNVDGTTSDGTKPLFNRGFGL